MNPDDKSHFLIWTLATAVVLAGGYVLYQKMNPPLAPIISKASPTTTTEAESQSQSAPVPGQPVMKIQADAPVIASTKNHLASITGDSDLQYEWSIKGGTIEGDTNRSTITWSAGDGTDVILSCKGTNTAGKATTVALRVVLQQPPAITRFEATPQVVVAGGSVKLSWTVTNAEKLTVNPGSQDVSKSDVTPLEVKPTETTTYTLSATNSTGITTTRELKVNVVPLPEITSFRAEPVAGTPDAYTVIGEFKAGKAEMKNAGAVIASGETSPLRASLTGVKEGSSLTFTVTSEAGNYVTTTLTFSTKK